MVKIYTKTGDNGETSLLGKRVTKNCAEIVALGELDELNASLGVMSAQINLGGLEKTKKQIIEIQNNLFVIGANVAALDTRLDNLPKLTEKNISDLEDWIDEMENSLPELRNFILPGGSMAAAQAFLARAVCRRAERSFINLSEKYKINDRDKIKKYLNRLSDYLFVLGRFLNKKSGAEEIIWVSASKN